MTSIRLPASLLQAVIDECLRLSPIAPPIEACIFNIRATDDVSPELKDYGSIKRSFNLQTSTRH